MTLLREGPGMGLTELVGDSGDVREAITTASLTCLINQFPVAGWTQSNFPSSSSSRKQLRRTMMFFFVFAVSRASARAPSQARWRALGSWFLQDLESACVSHGQENGTNGI